MKCSQCYKYFSDGVLLNADGDFACSEKCKTQYEKERDDFLNRICQSEVLTEQWLLGKTV